MNSGCRPGALITATQRFVTSDPQVRDGPDLGHIADLAKSARRPGSALRQSGNVCAPHLAQLNRECLSLLTSRNVSGGGPIGWELAIVVTASAAWRWRRRACKHRSRRNSALTLDKLSATPASVRLTG
jgi:hypothetical protein